MLLKKTKLNPENVQKVANMLRILENEKTFIILQLLADSNGMYVTDLVIKSKLVQPEISGILSKLRKYYIVSCTVEGKHRKYIINVKRFKHISMTIKNYVNNNFEPIKLKLY